MSAKWIRVTRQFKCPVCNHHDWCVIGEQQIVCMRVESPRQCKSGGWFHPVGAHFDAPPKPELRPERPHINATQLMRDWQAETDDAWISQLSTELGVSMESLVSLGCAWAWSHRAFAFPMKDGDGNIIGIRLRNQDGRKWAVTGSRAGLFYGSVREGDVLCVCEGPSDTAAGLSVGLNTVGRPSCMGQERFLVQMAKHAKSVLIIADNDSPGWSGAVRLQGMLKIPSLIWAPPAKDLRQFVRNGGTKQHVEYLTKSQTWTARKCG